MANARARALRAQLTDAERKLWSVLRHRQLDGRRFRRQTPIGRYIADFTCFECKLVVEVDGGQHAVEKDRDDARTARLESQGFRVLRFWNNEVLENTEGVVAAIRLAVSETKGN